MDDYVKLFQEECDGWSHEYTSATITNATLEQVAEIAAEYFIQGHSYYKDFGAVFSNGKAEEDGSISFTASRELPRKIADFFSIRLPDSVVFADVSWDYHKVYVRKNGEAYENFTARWAEKEPEPYEDEYEEDGDVYYDCDLILKDKESGVEFTTGGGMCTEDEFMYYTDLINNYSDNAPAKNRGR